MKKKTQSLIQVSMKLGEAVYKSQQKGAEKKGAESTKGDDDKIKKRIMLLMQILKK